MLPCDRDNQILPRLTYTEDLIYSHQEEEARRYSHTPIECTTCWFAQCGSSTQTACVIASVRKKWARTPDLNEDAAPGSTFRPGEYRTAERRQAAWSQPRSSNQECTGRQEVRAAAFEACALYVNARTNTHTLDIYTYTYTHIAIHIHAHTFTRLNTHTHLYMLHLPLKDAK